MRHHLFWMAVMAFLGSPALILADAHVWTGLSGSSWDEKDSWAPELVPTSSDAVFIGADAGPCYIGGFDWLTLDYGGTINVNGGVLNWTTTAKSSGWIQQAAFGSGAFSITDGGQVNINSPNQWMIGYYGGSGAISVDGSNSRLIVNNAQTWLGIQGRATLSVQNGGYAEVLTADFRSLCTQDHMRRCW